MKRKGFTLVELLIVIVIIGILAAAMLLSSGAATASAEASNVVSDLRNMKAGALMLYADSMDDFEGGTISALDVTMLTPYVDNPSKYTATNTPYILTRDTDNKWWVGYDLAKGNKNPDVKSKLAGRAKTTGLLGETNLYTPYAISYATVYMVAR